MFTPEQMAEIENAPTIGDQPQGSTTAITCPARTEVQPDSFAAPPWGNSGVAYPPYGASDSGGITGWIHDHPGWFLLLLLAGVMAYESMDGEKKKAAANAR